MALENYFEEFTTASVDLWSIVIAVILSALLGLILSEIYKKFGQSLSNRSKFSMLFPSIAMTTALIISVVKSSLALSLGLVGALSIIRFRTAIKEPEELAYLFLTISIGLGMGASLYFLTSIGFVLISGVIILISHTKKENFGVNFIVKSKTKVKDITSILKESNCKYILRRSDQGPAQSEHAFFIDSVNGEELDAISEKVNKIDPNAQVSYYESQVGI